MHQNSILLGAGGGKLSPNTSILEHMINIVTMQPTALQNYAMKRFQCSEEILNDIILGGKCRLK